MYESINVMALTATATCAVRHDAECVLGMKKPTIVVISPSKANIYYCVRKSDSIVDAFIPMMEQLRILRCDFSRTLIYCHKFSDCSDLYLHSKNVLGNGFTEPEDAPDLPQFRIVEMYHIAVRTL